MGVKIRKNRGKIYLDIYFKGFRKWESTGLTITPDQKQNKEVMRLAEILRSKRETQLVAGEYNLTDPIKGKDTLYSYIEKTLETLAERHPMRWTLMHLDKFPGGKVIRLSEVTPAWVEKFKEYLLQNKNIGSTTAYNYLKAIKQVLNKAVRENIIPKNPANSVQSIKKGEPDRVFLNREEVTAISKIPVTEPVETEIKKAFLFSCLTGIRVSDIKTLKWENIEHTADRTQIIKRQKKTGTKIYNPVQDGAWKIIDDKTQHNQEDSVFPIMAASKYDNARHLTALGEKAKLPKRLTWHVARRTFAVITLENGGDLYTVSKLLGHSSISTTMAYLKMTATMSKRVLDSLPEIDITD
jgi:site-specific recombinase XerD